nr:PREDICTED: uncharacterized protein LOC109031306 [Bemisia tabaci]XP_018898299.1 PREDICTED: uncharacterized protein LOC109031306 [Bemisia tabaci]
MDIQEHLTSKVFPASVESGAFGADVKRFVCFKANEKQGTDQFCSKVIFGDVTLEQLTGDRIIVSVVIKINKPEVKGMLDSYALFHNENLFYKEVLPFLKNYDTDDFISTSFPEFVYGTASPGENPEDNIIIMKDLTPKGFKLSADRLYLNQKHVELVLDAIGKYHGLTLKAQSDNPEKFKELTSQIKPTFVSGIADVMFPKEVNLAALLRGIEPLKNDGAYQDKLADLLAHCDNASFKWLGKATQDRSGPVNVIAHGDFHRSNVLFKYDSNGEPVQAALFDFATIRLCSPAIDTSVFLFINVPADIRKAQWTNFLRRYYDALCSPITGDAKPPSLTTLEQDLRERGVYGFRVVAVMAPMFISHMQGVEVMPPPGWEELDDEQKLKIMMEHMPNLLETGGTKATELLVGVVKHMIDNNFIFQDRFE